MKNNLPKTIEQRLQEAQFYPSEKSEVFYGYCVRIKDVREILQEALEEKVKRKSEFMYSEEFECKMFNGTIKVRLNECENGDFHLMCEEPVLSFRIPKKFFDDISGEALGAEEKKEGQCTECDNPIWKGKSLCFCKKHCQEFDKKAAQKKKCVLCDNEGVVLSHTEDVMPCPMGCKKAEPVPEERGEELPSLPPEARSKMEKYMVAHNGRFHLDCQHVAKIIRESLQSQESRHNKEMEELKAKFQKAIENDISL